jgi:3-isopropylmalate/(R)-2-methylmalate dehydratase small subunit
VSDRVEIRGGVVHMGDDLNTDVLHPSRFYSLDSSTVKSGLQTTAAQMSPPPGSSLESRQPGSDPGSDPASEGGAAPARSIVVGGRNFGYGSSRETTMQSLVLNGFRLVIAATVSRIFWRNAVNAGLWVLEVGEDVARLRGHDALIARPAEGRIADAAGNLLVQATPPDAYDIAVLGAGGMLGWLDEADGPL